MDYTDSDQGQYDWLEFEHEWTEEQMAKENTHGGSRKGSGRKPKEEGQGRSVPKSIKVSQEVADYLGEIGTGIIEDMIRRSKAFKDWQRRQGG